jgi:hypothetical protein
LLFNARASPACRSGRAAEPRWVPLVDATLDGIRGKFEVDTGARLSLLPYGPFVDQNNLRTLLPSGNEWHYRLETGRPIRSQIARGKIFKLGNLEVHDPFLEFLRSHSEVALKVAEILSNIYYATYREVRYLGLAGSVQEKLASFLLDFAAGHGSNNGQTRVVLTLTHEEIAAIIGFSQETVTRLFADFRRKGLVQIRGSTLFLADKTGLRGMLGA